MATQDLDHRLGEPEARKLIAFDRGERYGSIGLVLLVALVLVGVAVGYLLVGRGNAPPYILAILSILAVVGVFSLFAGAAGFLRLPGRDAGNAVGKAAVDGASDSIVVTDPSGRVVWKLVSTRNQVGGTTRTIVAVIDPVVFRKYRFVWAANAVDRALGCTPRTSQTHTGQYPVRKNNA